MLSHPRGAPRLGSVPRETSERVLPISPREDGAGKRGTLASGFQAPTVRKKRPLVMKPPACRSPVELTPKEASEFMEPTNLPEP